MVQEAARERLGLTQAFAGIIIVAIIGNAAEHSTAVLAALKNKVDLSLGIAELAAQETFPAHQLPVSM